MFYLLYTLNCINLMTPWHHYNTVFLIYLIEIVTRKINFIKALAK